MPESAVNEPAQPKQVEMPQEDIRLERVTTLLAQLEEMMKDAPMRKEGVNDAAAEIRQMREERTP